MDEPVLKNVETGHTIQILKSPFVIGRGLMCDYVIASKVVSRSHCSFEKTEQGWVLRDLSTNGTMVNDDVYKSVISPVLKPDDEICLGTFTYKFILNSTKVTDPQVERLKSEECSTVLNDRIMSPGTPNSFDEHGVSDEVLNKLADDILEAPMAVSNEVVISTASSSTAENVVKEQPAKPQAEDTSLSTILDFVLDNQRRIEVSTPSSPTNRPSTSAGLLNYQAANLQLREAHLQRELLKKNAELANKQLVQPTTSTSACTNSGNNVNTLLVDNNSVASLDGSKRLKLNSATMPVPTVQPSTLALQPTSSPKIKIIKMADGRFYSTLQQIVPAGSVVNANQSSAQLSMVSGDTAGPSTSSIVTTGETTETTEPEKFETKQKQSPEQNHFEQMEDELMCTICANLFIKAVTLGCSHSFCQYCIDEWKKKKSECPICRKPIASTIRTLVLDNIIEKMLESAPQEMRDQRKEATAERAKIEADAQAAAAKKAAATRGRNTARRGRRRQNNGPAVHAVQVALPVIELGSSSDSSNSNTDEDHYSDYEGDYGYEDAWEFINMAANGAYYGGYGRCYNCGDRGHWANGCPYR